MPAIVGIHGIAQQFQSGPQLTPVWFDALRGGLEAAGHRAYADGLMPGDMRVAYFADLFRPVGAMTEGDPQFVPADVAPGFERDLLTAMYDAAVMQEPSLGPGPDAMGRGWAAVEVMLERLLHSRSLAGVAQRMLIGSLRQVNRFLGEDAVKDAVLERVHAAIDEETRVLIGHSLGSVVAYEYLCRYEPVAVELLVTVGSPLGIPNLVFDRLTPAPVRGTGRWPGHVQKWVNIAAVDDIVALRKQLASLFPAGPSARTIEDRSVNNGNRPHEIGRYLNSVEFGNALGSVR